MRVVLTKLKMHNFPYIFHPPFEELDGWRKTMETLRGMINKELTGRNVIIMLCEGNIKRDTGKVCHISEVRLSLHLYNSINHS